MYSNKSPLKDKFAEFTKFTKAEKVICALSPIPLVGPLSLKNVMPVRFYYICLVSKSADAMS